MSDVSTAAPGGTIFAQVARVAKKLQERGATDSDYQAPPVFRGAVRAMQPVMQPNRPSAEAIEPRKPTDSKAK